MAKKFTVKPVYGSEISADCGDWDERFYQILEENGIDTTECDYSARIMWYSRFGDARRKEFFTVHGDYLAVLACSYVLDLQKYRPCEALQEYYGDCTPEEMWEKLSSYGYTSLENIIRRCAGGEEFDIVWLKNDSTGNVIIDSWDN